MLIHRFALNIECCSGFVFLLCILKLQLCCVEVHFFGHFMKSDSGSSFPGAQNASVVISKFSVNRDVHSSLWENKPSSY